MKLTTCQGESEIRCKCEVMNSYRGYEFDSVREVEKSSIVGPFPKWSLISFQELLVPDRMATRWVKIKVVL